MIEHTRARSDNRPSTSSENKTNNGKRRDEYVVNPTTILPYTMQTEESTNRERISQSNPRPVRIAV